MHVHKDIDTDTDTDIDTDTDTDTHLNKGVAVVNLTESPEKSPKRLQWQDGLAEYKKKKLKLKIKN